MALWDHGYVTDVAYTTNAYQETTPAWLAACSTLLGHRAPDLATPFRYADLGCGNGLSALIVAATNPHAEVWGFDFNPTHIENARAMAAEAKLPNARFEDVSFEALAQGAHPAADGFDFIASHGVLSWISLENRRHLTATIGHRLRPGGLAYISYNVTTGWAGMQAVRLLMRQLAEADRRRSDQTVSAIFQTLDQLKAGGAAYFATQPAVDARLTQMKAQDPRYLAHEFLNRDWHPVMFADVAEAMAETRTSYIGSATTIENVDAAILPEALVALLGSIPDAGIKETIRDIGSAKNFRRDLWRKGAQHLLGQEHLSLVDATMLVWSGRSTEGDVTFSGPIGTVTGEAKFYRPLLEAIQEGPKTVGQLRAIPAVRDRAPGEFIQAALLMMGGGYVHPSWRSVPRPAVGFPAGGTPPDGSGGMPPGGEHGAYAVSAAARDASARLNRVIGSRLRVGVDLHRAAAPLIGSSVAIDVMEGLTIGQLLIAGTRDPEALIDDVLRDVLQSGRSLLRDGQALRQPEEQRALVAETVHGLWARRLPLLRTLGVVD